MTKFTNEVLPFSCVKLIIQLHFSAHKYKPRMRLPILECLRCDSASVCPRPLQLYLHTLMHVFWFGFGY